MGRQLFRTALLGLALLSQQTRMASSQETQTAPDANHLPRVIIELTEIATSVAHLDELYALNSGAEFDAKLAELVASQSAKINRTYRLTSTSGQAVSMVFGKQVPVVTSVAKTAIGSTESKRMENFGTNIEAIATLQGETVAL